jgi:hypothetical protein
MSAYYDQLGLLSEYIALVYFYFDFTKKHADIILSDNSLHSVLRLFRMTACNAALAAVSILHAFNE